MGGRVVEGARLESVWARKGLASSNLAPSVQTNAPLSSENGAFLRGTGVPPRTDPQRPVRTLLPRWKTRRSRRTSGTRLDRHAPQGTADDRRPAWPRPG